MKKEGVILVDAVAKKATIIDIENMEDIKALLGDFSLAGVHQEHSLLNKNWSGDVDPEDGPDFCSYHNVSPAEHLAIYVSKNKSGNEWYFTHMNGMDWDLKLPFVEHVFNSSAIITGVYYDEHKDNITDLAAIMRSTCENVIKHCVAFTEKEKMDAIQTIQKDVEDYLSQWD